MKLRHRLIYSCKNSIAPVLLPIIQADLQAIEQSPSVIPLARSPSFQDKCGTKPVMSIFLPLNERTTLDKCLWSLSLTSWICTRCGRMFCLTCFFDGHKQCCYVVLLLTSAIHLNELAIMVQDVAKIASELPTEEAHLPLHGSSRELRVVAGALDLDNVWPNRSPIALRGTPGLQLDWSPSGLADAFGDDACIIEDCEVPGQRLKTTIRSFFEGLVTLDSGDETSGSILKLKVGYSDVAFE